MFIIIPDALIINLCQNSTLLTLQKVHLSFWSFQRSITASDVVFGCFCDQNCFLSVVPIFSTTFGYKDKANKNVLHSQALKVKIYKKFTTSIHIFRKYQIEIVIEKDNWNFLTLNFSASFQNILKKVGHEWWKNF